MLVVLCIEKPCYVIYNLWEYGLNHAHPTKDKQELAAQFYDKGSKKKRESNTLQ